ncbi:peroxisomal membrane protein PMP34 isoform X2 [Dendrobates tinctorius]|uniref:peroxisomal membrane protein PMP34 isoform X2 n=1 Tax=Dendrobates tinctorius TaxID=92724 RepID=UPI003CC9EC34
MKRTYCASVKQEDCTAALTCLFPADSGITSAAEVTRSRNFQNEAWNPEVMRRPQLIMEEEPESCNPSVADIRTAMSSILSYEILVHAVSGAVERCCTRRRNRRTAPKRMWVHPIVQEREDKGHFNLLYQDLRKYPDKFVNFCRLTIPAFDRLLDLLSPELNYQETVMRRPISAEERLLITFRFLATGESYTSLHLQFRGSVTAMSVFYPLDTARLRLQVDEQRKSRSTPAVLMEIIKEEGLLAPYRGWFPVISSLCCSNFVYFYTFKSLKSLWIRRTAATTSMDLTIGFIAGIVNVLLTTPLWVVNTRLKLQGAKFRNDDIKPTSYTGIADAFQKILQQEGFLSLWNGTLPSLLLVFNPAIQFMFYEGLKRQLLSQQAEFGHEKLNPEKRTLGSLFNIIHLLKQRIRCLGYVGLYKGLEAKLLQTVLTAALMFLVYEKLAAMTFRVMGLKSQ